MNHENPNVYNWRPGCNDIATSTQDSTVSLLSAVCSNYELLSIILCTYVACKVQLTVLCMFISSIFALLQVLHGANLRPSVNGYGVHSNNID